MKFASVLLSYTALQMKTAQAFHDISRNGTVASKEFVNPILSKDVITDESNFKEPTPVKIPAKYLHWIDDLESNLGASGTQIDVNSGKVESLTLSQPIMPGNGVENRLLWSVSSEIDTMHASPSTAEEWEEMAIQAVKSWMIEHANDLGINVDSELFASGSVRSAVHGNGDMIQLHIPRIFKGIPVIGARAMATIKLGNLISVGFEDWGTIPEDMNVIPILSPDDAYNALAESMGLTLIRGESKCDAQLQILTLTPSRSKKFGRGYEYVLAWSVCPLFEGQDVEVMEGLVNAGTGEVYSFIDKVHYFESKGGVYPISNDQRYPDGLQQNGWPMPYMYVGNEITDTGGNYFGTGSVTASFNGPYVSISDSCGSSSLSGNSGLDWSTSGGTDCTTPGVGNRGNTHSARTNFYELNKVIEMAKSHLPSNSWLKQRLRVNVNINDSCNAWWLNTINFYRRGNGCGNTGELPGVIVHEWGHGLDDNDVTGSIARPSGEGIADIYAALRMGDSCIGRGFFLNGGTCTGVRNVDYKQGSGKPKKMSNHGCGSSVHCLGGVYSEAIWSLYKRTLQSAPYNYDDNTALEIVTRLTFIAGKRIDMFMIALNSFENLSSSSTFCLNTCTAGNVGTWFGGSAPWGGCGSASGYREYLAADDDNGNINDGTPHMGAIYKAFNDQEIACNTPAVKDSGCFGTPIVAPQVSVTPGNMQAVISWSQVNGASKYEVFRTEGVKQCGQGKVKLTTTTLLSYTDTGLMNGREYYYIVIPKGPNDSCFGPASECMIVEPTETPVPTTPSPTKKPSPPTTSPTNQPTQRCGNGFCEVDEHSSTCPVDCSNRELDVITDSPKGAPGIMFWLKADSRDIDISSFKFFTWSTTVNLVQIYTRPGEYTGFEVDQSGWEKVYEETIQLKGGGNLMTELSFTNKISVNSGSSQSFFIWITDNAYIKYEAGTSEGALLDSDGFIEFYQGVGITSLFGGSYADVYRTRRFSGIVSYDVIGSPATAPPTTNPTTPFPTKQPNSSSPTIRPSLRPSNQPISRSPTLQPTRNPTRKPVTLKPTSPPSKAPTPLPSSTCNDGTCQIHESSSTCPQDCSGIIWTAHNGGNSGAQGIMFELMAARDVIVKTFDIYTDEARNDVIEVYTRSGTYSGHEVDASGWTLVSSKSVQQMGRSEVTELGDFDSEVSIRAGSIQSFYIYSSNIIMYDTGTVRGDIFDSDGSLTIYQGSGIASSKFPGTGASGVIYAPRLFKGNIKYDAVTLSTDAPTINSPTWHPTARPSTLNPITSPSNIPTSVPTQKPQLCAAIATEQDCLASILGCRWRPVLGVCAQSRIGKASKRGSSNA